MSGELYTVRAFGRLEVENAEGPIALGGPRPRTVFAVLLVAGRAVSTERLVDETWGRDAPSGARRTLQGYVSGLRRALGGDGGPLRSEAAGYRLEREQLDVDLTSFEALATEGREKLASRRPQEGAALLDRALELWVDEPFADLPADDVPSLSIERTRLGELRMSAIEVRLEARLASGHAGDLVPELEQLVAVHPEREGLWRHLMVALHQSGRTAEAMRAAERCRRFLAAELGLEPGEELRRLEHRIAAGERVVEAPTPRADVRAVACPYKGLAAYQPEDQALYFGHERLLDRLIARLAERPLVALVGPSGTGKSSVMRAGLVPALAAGALPGAPWDVTLLTPGATPVCDVAIPAAAPGRRSLLVIDQFEELFTRNRDARERGTFVERLVAAASGDGTARIVVAVRADFYGRLAENERFASLVSDGTILMGPMSTSDLARAVTGPAQQVGLAVEPALVEAIVADAGGEAGALPLVSHALVETWARREGDTLTLAGYLQAGGVVGALAQTADRTMRGRLSPEHQAVARDLLLRLVEPAEDGPDTRRTVALDELLRTSTDAGTVEAVIAVLTDSRLLTVDEDGVRLTHEALIREWPTLRSWLDQERQDLLVRRQLADDARRWDRDGRDPADLLRGMRLAAVTDWRRDTTLPLSELETDFVDASVELAEQQQREANERAAQQARSNRRLRLLVAVVLVAFLGAAAMGAVALRQWRRADASAEAAMARQLAAQVDAVRDTDLDLALLLAAEAVGFADRAETRRVLLDALHEEPRLRRLVPVPPASWADVEVSADGSTLVALDDEGEDALTIISLRDGRPVAAPAALPEPEHEALPPALAVSDDGRLAAVQQPDGTVHVFDGRTGRPTGVTVGHGIARGDLAFGPNGDWLAILSVIGPPDVHTTTEEVPTAGLIVVDARTGARLGPELVVADFAPVAMSVAPDGRTIAAVDTFVDAVAVWSWPEATTMSRFLGPEGAATITVDAGRVAVAGRNTIRVHDATSGRPVTGPMTQPTEARSLAFAPGNRLLSGGADGWRVWDLNAPRQQGPAVTGGGRVDALRVVADGDVVTAGLGGQTVVWSLEELPVIGTRLPVPFAGFFAPDGSRLVSADPAIPGRLALYELFPFRERWEVSLGSAEDHADRLAWSPDGARIAALTRVGELLVLSATDGAVVLGEVAVLGSSEQVRAATFSPSGDRLAITTSGGRLLLVDPDTGRLHAEPIDLDHPVNAIVFTSDDRLVAGTDGGTVLRIDIDDARVERLFSTGRGDAIHVVYTAPRGRLVVGGEDGLLSIWRVDDGSRAAQLDAGRAAVRGVTVSPDGRWLAASLESGETRLFDIASGASAGTLGVASSTVGWPHPAGFSPDGSALATWDNRSYVVWRFDAAVWQELACTVAGRSLTEAETALFFDDPAREPACSG